VFSHDLLQVQVLKQNRRDVLVTVFVNHLKSQYVPFDVDDADAEATRANELRQRQCAAIEMIIAAETPDESLPPRWRHERPARFGVHGSATASPKLNVISGLADAKETHPGPGNPPPSTTAWTNASNRRASRLSTRSWIRSG
jgi:hypothetical protein